MNQTTFNLDLAPLTSALQDTPLAAWAEALPQTLALRLAPDSHGDLPAWLAAIDALPHIRARQIDLNAPCIRIGAPDEINADTREQIEAALRQLHPWRKGPFDVFGIHIDTEWRSDWKWDRIVRHLAPLAGRRVLDVGSGNGYFALRMIGAGAALVVAIDPMRLFLMQFEALRRFHDTGRACVLPLGIEDFPERSETFDTVFSMGVLYHRRSPLDHLYQLREALRPGGELVLETLVIPGGTGQVLVPEGRYARMRNVWFIPTVAELERWLARCGLRDIRCVDESPTTLEEQRSTDWMQFESLARSLDPADPTRTVEGYPAPRRAVLIARRP
ncbi:tRNA 5-methoxyuridine(34)/uridine 5-oxyacetic acid(34) synthase CmoB [Thiohalobacter thiocyanaticus]|uniref:tRNA U34 carboxymethyltransferase n=1 Tax=Thiohalobacter thiocyanaticus TaxID=585455 RepID=A0A426QEG1_9GAMM|nr:tRNA 5-methoxyuridine(34)/uridine 5-oxyacetic acid(34) synthase CmoB [Thiohalobacter thiocyanaticus]RRQ20127.1 tRNA 5-methoxyuridine(34)/uridine 5-oxyacetic acid(34) synthase CmoB [Thiohalobacter thiocyanaticus]